MGAVIRLWMLGLLLSSQAFSSMWPKDCVACHTPERSVAAARFGNGMGQWKDAQCFGCHEEFNEIGKLYAQGIRDKRYYALPMKDERLQTLGDRPLPYSTAPLELDAARYSREGLLRFLQRPHALSQEGAPRMPAFPELTAQQLQALPRETTKGRAKAGEAFFRAQCEGCHAASDPVSGFSPLQLSLYSSAWIHSYANGGKGSSERKMPKLVISEQDAADIQAWLASKRREAETRLDAAVSRLTPPPVKAKINATAIAQYMETSFFRDGACVHCHGIEGRAKQKFDTSPAGLRQWFRHNDPKQLWKRLEIRALEEEAGLGAKTPGMPMTGPALPEPLRQLVLAWIQSGCLITSGEKTC